MKNVYFLISAIFLMFSNAFPSAATTQENDYVLLSANTVALATPIVTVGVGFTAYVYRHTLQRKLSACGSCLSDCCCASCKSSSHKMDVKEVLSPNMEKAHLELIENIDRTLSGKKQDGQEWNKFPIYGNFGHTYQNFFVRLLSCGRQENEDYLYGYRYENGRYAIEARRHFSRKAPEDVPLNDFKKINPAFKYFEIGIEEQPLYSPQEDIELVEDEENKTTVFEHQHLNDNNFANFADGGALDVKDFVSLLLKKGHFLSKGATSRAFNANPFFNLLKLYEEGFRIQIAAIDEEVNKKENKRSRHVYFLFPTTHRDKIDEENYQIVLHVEEDVEDYLNYKAIIPDGLRFFPGIDNSVHLQLGEIEKNKGGYSFEEAIGLKRQGSSELHEGGANNELVRYWVAQDIFRLLEDNDLPDSLTEVFSELKEKKQELLTNLETNFKKHAEFVLA